MRGRSRHRTHAARCDPEVRVGRQYVVHESASRGADSSEVDVAALDVHGDQLHADAVADVDARCSLHQHTLGGDFQKPYPRAFGGGAGDDAIELLADARFEEKGGRGFADLPLDLVGGVFGLRAMLGEGVELAPGVGWRCSRNGDLEQALCDEIGIAAIRGRGVGVVLDGKAEVSRDGIARHFRDVLTRPSLTTESDRSGNRSGSAAFCFVRKSSSALESGLPGSVLPCSRASSTMRSHRFGVRTTRRIDGKPFEERYRAVSPLAAIMKSSIKPLARLLSSARSSVSTSPSNTGRASMVCKLNAPCRWRNAFIACATRS